MPQRPGHLELHLAAQIGDRGLGADVQPQRDDIRRDAAGAAHESGGARGDRQAEDDVLGAVPLREVGRERGDQLLGGRGFVAAHRFVERGVLVVGERALDHTVAGGRGGRTPGQAGALLETRDPFGPVLLIGAEAVALAVGDLLVVQGAQLRGLGRRGFHTRPVGRVQLGHPVHHVHGAVAVDHDVVGAHIPVPVVLTQVQGGGTDEAVGGQIQRAAVLVAHPLPGGGDRIGGGTQVHVADLVLEAVIDELQRFPVAFDDAQQARTQLVGSVQTGPGQGVDIELTVQFDVLGDIDRHLWVDMLRVPDTQLCRRQGEQIPVGGCRTTVRTVPAVVQPVQP